MATNSVLKNISISDKRDALRLLRALECAAGKKGKTITLRKKHTQITGDDIRTFFGEDKCLDTKE